MSKLEKQMGIFFKKYFLYTSSEIAHFFNGWHRLGSPRNIVIKGYSNLKTHSKLKINFIFLVKMVIKTIFLGKSPTQIFFKNVNFIKTDLIAFKMFLLIIFFPFL